MYYNRNKTKKKICMHYGIILNCVSRWKLSLYCCLTLFCLQFIIHAATNSVLFSENYCSCIYMTFRSIMNTFRLDMHVSCLSSFFLISTTIDVTWSPWRLKLPVNRLFVQQLVLANNKAIGNLDFWPSVREYTPMAGEFSHKDLLCGKCFYFVTFMMTSSNGSIFRVTGHLCGEFTGDRWISRTKANDAELWCFLWSAPEWTIE